jgi:hypothetical protein
MRYKATVQGEIWRIVRCENCGTPYAYRMEIEASADSSSLLGLNDQGAQQRAAAQAALNLQAKSQVSVAAVPCPECGYYQRHMARRFRSQYLHWTLIAGVVALAGGLAVLFSDVPYGWVGATGLISVGAAFMILGALWRPRIDPNAGDPEPRKQLGRACALWGERLKLLLEEQDV